MADPNLIVLVLSREVSVGGNTLRIDIYCLEDDPSRTMEVVNRHGISTDWDDPFDSDQGALDEAFHVIAEEGPDAFHYDGNVISFPRRYVGPGPWWMIRE